MKFPCFFPSLHCIPHYPIPLIGMVLWFLFSVLFFFFFEREKIYRDFINTEYTFDSILPHCFPYILANNWYYLTLILIFFCQPVKECVIVLFLISLIAREFKYFFTDLLTIQISLV